MDLKNNTNELSKEDKQKVVYQLLKRNIDQSNKEQLEYIETLIDDSNKTLEKRMYKNMYFLEKKYRKQGIRSLIGKIVLISLIVGLIQYYGFTEYRLILAVTEFLF